MQHNIKLDKLAKIQIQNYNADAVQYHMKPETIIFLFNYLIVNKLTWSVGLIFSAVSNRIYVDCKNHYVECFEELCEDLGITIVRERDVV